MTSGAAGEKMGAGIALDAAKQIGRVLEDPPLAGIEATLREQIGDATESEVESAQDPQIPRSRSVVVGEADAELLVGAGQLLGELAHRIPERAGL